MYKISKGYKFSKGDTVKIDAITGSWGIVIRVHPSTDLYDVQWYYGKDVKGEYMTAVSNSLKYYELISVNKEDFWRHANRDGFTDELGAPTPEPIFTMDEIIRWYKGEPKISGPYLIKVTDSYPIYAYWDATNKEYTAHDGGLLTFSSDDIIYFTQSPKGP